jgi:hypothetical protein
MTLWLWLLPLEAGQSMAAEGLGPETVRALTRAGMRVTSSPRGEWDPSRVCDHLILNSGTASGLPLAGLLAQVAPGGSLAVSVPAGLLPGRRAARLTDALKREGLGATTAWLTGAPAEDPPWCVELGRAPQVRWLFGRILVPWSRREVLMTRISAAGGLSATVVPSLGGRVVVVGRVDQEAGVPTC